LILLPNSPQAGSDMLNNMVASFTASNLVGESMKTGMRKVEPKKNKTLPKENNLEEENPETDV
jgi:hypothetical protein